MIMYFSIKLIHILSSTILFGTGLGSAFYFFVAHRSGHLPSIVFATKWCVKADWFFTTPAVIIQLITGLWLANAAGWKLTDSWVSLALLLYVFAGICWLPVVYLQIKMRDMAQQCLVTETTLPACYFRYEKWWVILGSLAFPAVMIIFALMVFKPTF